MFVKICGITSELDALGVIAVGADAIGFVFAPSPRRVDQVTAGDITRRLPAEILNVGVFMDHSKENVVKIADKVGLQVVQLHGSESPAETKWIKDRVPYVIKGFVGGSPLLANAWDWGADAILIDAPKPGSGEIFDWETAVNVPPGLRVILAGGLTVENVGRAIEQVRPWGVDVSTGVEWDVGKKDQHKTMEFVAAAKSAAMRIAQQASEDNQAEGNPTESTELDRPFDWDGEIL